MGKTGAHPKDWAINPAVKTEANSASLVGTCRNPMSTDTFGVYFVTFAIADSKKSIPRPRMAANAKKSARKWKPEFANRNVATKPIMF